MSLDVPEEVAALFRNRGYTGTSLELQGARAHIRELWATRSNAKGGAQLCRSKQGQAMTIVARMRSCEARDLVVFALREAGRFFRANSLASWRPFVLIALGLLAEPLDCIEAMDPVAVHRIWPAARGVATKFQKRPRTTENPMLHGGLGRE